MSTPQWSRVARTLAACAGLVLIAACASSGAGSSADGDARARGTSQSNRLTRADIEANPGTDIATLIETKLSGVRVIRQGNDWIVRMRGTGAFYAGNDAANADALVLVDGMEASLGSVSRENIESIEILKDAAAAIYGVRGANGVLLIRTMRR